MRSILMSHMVIVGQCDLDLGSSHYIRADTGLPDTQTM